MHQNTVITYKVSIKSCIYNIFLTHFHLNINYKKGTNMQLIYRYCFKIISTLLTQSIFPVLNGNASQTVEAHKIIPKIKKIKLIFILILFDVSLKQKWSCSRDVNQSVIPLRLQGVGILVLFKRTTTPTHCFRRASRAVMKQIYTYVALT